MSQQGGEGVGQIMHLLYLELFTSYSEIYFGFNIFQKYLQYF